MNRLIFFEIYHEQIRTQNKHFLELEACGVPWKNKMVLQNLEEQLSRELSKLYDLADTCDEKALIAALDEIEMLLPNYRV